MGNNNAKAKRNEGKDDIVEAVVCNEKDFKENEMKSFDINDAKVLVVRQRGKFYAVGNKCSHYGAPLHTGYLGEERVRCPWHGACFSLVTGDIEDYPGLDSLPCFKVDVQADGGVRVQARKSQLASAVRQKSMAVCDKNDPTTFLVVGGGPAAQVCAETLRQDGFQGKLIMVSKESVVPYDRIKLSKSLDVTADKIALRPAQFFKDNSIDLKLGVELVELNTAEKTARLSSGDTVKYDSCFLATGASARPVSGPGSDLKNIFVLRSVDQANTIAKEITNDKHVVIVGSSFIGMEIAAFCAGKAKSVTVVGRDCVPFGPVLGLEIGKRIMKLFQEKNVKFKMTTDVTAFLPSEKDASFVGKVQLKNCETLPADVVVAGIGTIPNTECLSNSGVTIGKGGTVPVNEFLATNVPGVFAGGDIAYAPVFGGQTASIGHWQLAEFHGRTAAKNMLGKNEPLKSVPFFWTMLFGKGIRYAGFAPGFDNVVLHGNLEEMKFMAYYCKGKSVMAMAACCDEPIASQFAEHLWSGGQVTVDQVCKDPRAWTKKGQ